MKLPVSETELPAAAAVDAAAAEADATIAAHVALREALIPNPRGWIHKSPGLIASAADIACPNCNTIYVHGAEADEAEFAETIRLLEGRGNPFQASIRGALAGRYGPVAAAAGLAHLTDLPMMTLKPGEFRPAPAAEGLALRVLPPGAEPYHLDLVAEGLGMSREGIGLLMSPANLAAPIWTTYIGEVDGTLAVTGSAIAGAAGSGLISIVTDPRFGRRGFAAALTSAAIADAFAAGRPRVFLHSSDQGYRVYERLGFRVVEHLSIFGRPDDHHS
jgi:GNAT superfamily N-acetyltransferase